MKLSHSIISRLNLDKESLDELQTALAHDHHIVHTLLRIIEIRLSDTKEQYADYDKPNWPYRRAFKDGARRELELLLKLYKE